MKNVLIVAACTFFACSCQKESVEPEKDLVVPKKEQKVTRFVSFEGSVSVRLNSESTNERIFQFKKGDEIEASGIGFITRFSKIGCDTLKREDFATLKDSITDSGVCIRTITIIKE